MIGYMMKNDDGEYLAMDGGTTSDWFKASKFDYSGIKDHEIYLKCGYELISFEINQLGKAQPKPCGEYCEVEFKISIEKEGIFSSCEKCNSKLKVVSNVF